MVNDFDRIGGFPLWIRRVPTDADAVGHLARNGRLLLQSLEHGDPSSLSLRKKFLVFTSGR